MGTKKKLFIVGAGGFGREVYGVARAVSAAGSNWEVAGFLDYNDHVLQKYSYPVKNHGDPASYQPAVGDCFVCAIGDPAGKLKISAELKARGAEFITLIHPNALVGPNCVVGEGCILCAGAILTADVTLGNFVTINVHSGAGHDAVIGDGCTLSAHVDITGGVQLGKGVFLGSHASVLPKVKVGDFAKIGAGSVVVRNVPAHGVVFGVPAKTIYSPA